MERCTLPDLAIALDCFASAKYSSKRLTPGRVAQAIGSLYKEGGGHEVTRYLCLCPHFGVVDPELKVSLAERLVNVADHPQQCSNAVLALAKQGVDAEEIAIDLIEKMARTMRVCADPQNVGNAFLALSIGKWTISNRLAIDLLDVVTHARKEVVYLDCVQVLAGIERHGVTAPESRISLLVERLIQLGFRGQHRQQLGDVVASLRSISYPNEQHLKDLQVLAGDDKTKP